MLSSASLLFVNRWPEIRSICANDKFINNFLLVYPISKSVNIHFIFIFIFFFIFFLVTSQINIYAKKKKQHEGENLKKRLYWWKWKRTVSLYGQSEPRLHFHLKPTKRRKLIYLRRILETFCQEYGQLDGTFGHKSFLKRAGVMVASIGSRIHRFATMDAITGKIRRAYFSVSRFFI